MPLPRRFLCRKRDPPTIRQENHLEQIKLARSKASNLLVPDDYDGSTYHAKLSRELAAVSQSAVSMTLHLLGALGLKALKQFTGVSECMHVFHMNETKPVAGTFLFPTLTTPTLT